MKIVNARFTEGEHAELVKLAWNNRRTVASQVAYMINRAIKSQTLPPQRREHDTDTDPRTAATISEVLGLNKEQDSE